MHVVSLPAASAVRRMAPCAAAAAAAHSSGGRCWAATWRALLPLAVLGLAMVPNCSAAVTFAVSAGATDYTERTAAITIDSGFTVTSDANDQLSKAVVTMTTPDGITNDVLEFPSLGGGLISVDYVAATKTVELRGTASTAVYQQALRALTFYNPSSTPEITDRKVRPGCVLLLHEHILCLAHAVFARGSDRCDCRRSCFGYTMRAELSSLQQTTSKPFTFSQWMTLPC